MLERVNIVWFKRDLRLTDHAVLAYACNQGLPVILLYVIEPDLWCLPDLSYRHYQFLLQALNDLRQQCRALDATLVVKVGEVIDVIAQHCF